MQAAQVTTHTDPDRVFAENRRWEVMVRRALLNG